ncbi:hypothetical protein RS022_05320 [Candidatus Phytoplasma rubi]|uniref:Integral membrane protein n=1 Tax=Candidatus Phytoplasma rubi TaxID=399025 RepID=A0ABY7BRY2_9MOLU|nr:hypothetical protein [Candidatus Phytoplasma rubi]WAN63405.1 hypothetical protein RS022_05320 [Candidatus Phytoplasma rubi]
MFDKSKKKLSRKAFIFLIVFIIFSSATYFIKLNTYSFRRFFCIQGYIYYSEQNLLTFIHGVYYNTFYNFTFQSNFLVLLFCIGTLNYKFRNSKNYSLWAFCVLVDILLTGVVWNLIADPFVDYKNFKYEFLTVSLCEHTYIPILFTIFYFSNFYINPPFTSYRKNYLALIHPLFYLFYSLILGSIENQHNFMNPFSSCNISLIINNLFDLNFYNNSSQGWFGVLINNVFLLLVLLIVIPILFRIKKILVNKNFLPSKKK